MKRRLTALILALVLIFALGASAVSADDDAAEAAVETPEAAETAVLSDTAETDAAAVAPSDEEGRLSFADIEARMLANNYSMLALQEGIDDVESHDYAWKEDRLRDDLNGIADKQWEAITAVNPLSALQLPTLQAQYDSLRTQFDALRDGEVQEDDAAEVRKNRQMQDLMVMGAELYYIAIKTIEESDTAMTRGIAAVDRYLTTVDVSYRHGLASLQDVQQVENERAQLASTQKTLRMNYETKLLELKALVGAELGEPLKLGALPKVTAAQLNAMDLEADLARAMEASYDLYDAQRQIDSFKKDYYDPAIEYYGQNSKAFEVSQVKHSLQALKYSRENVRQSFELKFRTLYLQIQDHAQALDAAKSALALEEKNYAVSALKYEQGTISRNALADAADTLASAKDTVSSAERDLFTAYRSYYWAVEHGILN